jgi:hypothetical protein
VPRSRPKRLREAKHRLEEELSFEQRANDLYEAWRERETRKRGRGQMAPGAVRPYVPPNSPQGKINVTDPDSRLMKDSRGFVQGYNAQVTVNDEQIVLAAEVMLSASDFGHLEPMVDAMQAELERADVEAKPDVVLADAGYWHQRQMENVVDRGMPVLIPPDGGKRKSARPGWDKGLYAFMRRVLQTERGGELYRKRKAIVEPMFANTKYNRRLDRFRRRGRAAARSEWRLITATHNLLKLHQHQMAMAGT